jgi:hypothetical protein
LPEPNRSKDPEVKCPWCGKLNRDLWEYEEGTHERECGWCEKPILLSVAVSVTYTLAARGVAS